MTDLAGRAELRAAAERAVFDAWAVRDGALPTADESWWHIHRSGPTQTKWAADAAFDAIEPTLAAVEADRDRLQGEVNRLTALREQDAVAAEEYGRLIVQREQERDEARAQLAERDALIAKAERWVANCIDPVAVGVDVKAQMLDELQAALAASRPSPDTTETTG